VSLSDSDAIKEGSADADTERTLVFGASVRELVGTTTANVGHSVGHSDCQAV
jgi:hypothetical protein